MPVTSLGSDPQVQAWWHSHREAVSVTILPADIHGLGVAPRSVCSEQAGRGPHLLRRALRMNAISSVEESLSMAAM
jgi:hypothetical protein